MVSELRRLGSELKANRRAQAGLAVIALLVAAVAWSELDAALGRLRQGYEADRLRLERVVALHDQGVWAERAEASATLRRSLENRLWPAETEGAAAANLSDFITNAGRQAGLANLQVKVDLSRPKSLPNDYRQMTATVSAVFAEQSLEGFLDRLEREPKLLVVERLAIQQQPFPRVDLTLQAYLRMSPPAVGAAR